MAPVFVVRLKAGVKLGNLAPAGIRILGAIDYVAQAQQINMLISSGGEERGRLATDPHMTGEALDLSVSNMTPGEIVKVKHALEAELGHLFTVLYEVPTLPLDTALQAIAYVNPSATGAHLHMQRRKDTVYPPAEAPIPATRDAALV